MQTRNSNNNNNNNNSNNTTTPTQATKTTTNKRQQHSNTTTTTTTTDRKTANTATPTRATETTTNKRQQHSNTTTTTTTDRKQPQQHNKDVTTEVAMFWVYSDADSRGIQKATKDDSGYLGSITFRQQNDDNDDDKTKTMQLHNRCGDVLGVFRSQFRRYSEGSRRRCPFRRYSEGNEIRFRVFGVSHIQSTKRRRRQNVKQLQHYNKGSDHRQLLLGLFSVLGVFISTAASRVCSAYWVYSESLEVFRIWVSHWRGSDENLSGSQGSIAPLHPTVCRSSFGWPDSESRHTASAIGA